MKKTIVLLGFILVIFLGFYFYKISDFSFNEKSQEDSKVLGLPYQKEEKELELILDEKKIGVDWFWVDKSENLFLYPNFEKKLTSREAKEEYGCKYLANGGFYNKDFSPIGLFVWEKKVLNSFSFSNTFNAIFSVNYFETPRITASVPSDPLRIALQSGPLLIENSFVKNLSLKRDDPARRIVLATTGENKSLFIVFYDKDSFYLGPYLKDLGKLLTIFQEKTEIIISDAINLDGGSTSVYQEPDFYLPEIAFSGSFFCLK